MEGGFAITYLGDFLRRSRSRRFHLPL